MLIKFDAANRSKVIALLAVIVFLFAGPSFLSSYLLYILTLLLINIIVVVSFRFITLMGRLSFVHISLWGMGAYATGLLTVKLGLPFWVGIPVAALATAVCGLVVAVPCLRMKGVYFILATFASAEAIRQVWIRFRVPFGGQAGVSGMTTPPAIPYFYLVLILAALSVVIMYRIEFSKVGDAIKSVALDELLAESVGIHSWRYRILTFIIAAFFVGLAGALFAHTTGAVAPGDFTFPVMLTVIIAFILGGSANIFGPMIGITLLTAVEYLGVRLLEWLPLVLGCILIVVTLLLPGGLQSLPRRISVWWRQTR